MKITYKILEKIFEEGNTDHEIMEEIMAVVEDRPSYYTKTEEDW